MQLTDCVTTKCKSLHTFTRNRYFYGQLLDVEHFDGDQRYFNEKRWLLNRTISGWGVVCGLDVQLRDGGKSIVVMPGLALDQCGREIVVPCPSHYVPIPAPTPSGEKKEQAPEGDPRQANWPRKGHHAGGDDHCDDSDSVHVCLYYCECETDPAPVMASDCDSQQYCVSGKTAERYRICFKRGKARRPDIECSVPDMISGGRINYPALAVRVTENCPSPPEDTCVPLANIRIPESGLPHPNDIDITIRPIVYSNDLLWELIAGLVNESQPQARGGKY
jgi:hypothetical protein